MAQVELRQLRKTFFDPQTRKEVTAVNDLNLTVRDGEFLVLVGPSGCGKSTALRMLAGLEESTSGDIMIGARRVNDMPPRERNIAMVFQNYALYPHMSVYENMAFGLRQRLLPGFWIRMTDREGTRRIRADIDRRIREASEMLDIGHLLDRKPKALSGGQRQRVALGRAIVREPQVFLMDEPLSNLDAKLRVQTRAELTKLHRRLGVTTVYVTHDQVEAVTMGQRIAVMRDGVLQQCAPPLELYREPANLFVAGFIGTPAMNLIPARIPGRGGDEAPVVDCGGFEVRLPPGWTERLEGHFGKQIILGIRPENIREASLSGENSLRVCVDVVEPMGSSCLVFAKAGAHTITASLEADAKAREGESLQLEIDTAAVHLFDTETECAIPRPVSLA